MSIKSELLNLKHASTDNILRVEDVVAWARENPASALYHSIEWDDAMAAEAHRFWQVRQLIAVHVIADDGSPLVVSLSIDRTKGGGYRDVADVGQRPDLRQIMLEDALAELERVRVKYERVSELARVWEEADRAKAAAPSRRRVGKRNAVPA